MSGVEKTTVLSVALPTGVVAEFSVGSQGVSGRGSLVTDMLEDLGIGRFHRSSERVSSNQPIKLTLYTPPGKGKETAAALRALADEVEGT